MKTLIAFAKEMHQCEKVKHEIIKFAFIVLLVAVLWWFSGCTHLY